jgi:hypothetical protein
VVAVNQHEVHVLKWHTENNMPVEVGAVLHTRPATHGEGTGPDGLSGHPVDLQHGLTDHAILLSVTCDKHTRYQGEAVNECTVMAVLRRTVALPAEPEEDNWLEVGPQSTVFTDGSYAQHGTIAEWSSGREQTVAAAGVVISSNSGDTRLRITGELQMTSAYDAEVVSLAVAGRMIRGATIYSDCKSAMAATLFPWAVHENPVTQRLNQHHRHQDQNSHSHHHRPNHYQRPPNTTCDILPGRLHWGTIVFTHTHWC